ncbi:MAG: DUF11 domain-containing protein [Candidatus Contendobacter sp.]|nr:DUF11 domain-containing protein [Candidatus Contendobacter sp.]
MATDNAFGAGGDTQATATCITSLPYNDTGTTVGATDNYDLPADTTAPTLTATCATIANGAGPAGSLPRGAVYAGTGTAPDVVYQLSFPSGNPDTLTITMDPTGAQDLALITYCNTVSSSLADGLAIDDTGVGGVAESVTVGNIAAGTTLYIVVDGYSTGGTPPGPSGPYALSITSNGATQPAPCNGASSADLSITKTNGSTTSTPGTPTTYTLVASNAGPSAVTGATVADTFPAACTSVSYTSVAAGGATGNTAGPASGNINDTALNLPVGASVTYTAICAIDPTATGTLANTATIASSTTDPTPGNNSATDTDTLTTSADLSITKTNGSTTSTPGTPTTYTLVASNAGPSAVTNATVADTFPAACASVSYTSVAASGATGNTAGPASGNINDTALNLPAGASVIYTATCTIDPTATGTLANTATISSPFPDSDPTNNSATDSSTLTPQADLSITKTNGSTTSTPGLTTTYTLVAANAGPSAVINASVADTFPAACASVSYTSVAAGGATGNTAGPASGNINDTALNLPVGASVTYTAICTIDPTATGTLVNTATIASSATDPTPGNNSATDTDTLIQLATLTIQLDAPGSAPTTFDFTTVGLTPTAFSLQHGQTQTFTNLIPGQSYTVNDQPPPPGWVLDEVLCSVPAPQCVISSITLTPTAGQDVTGTFRFRRLAGVAEGIPVFSVWGLSALIGLFGLALARLRRRV